MPRKLRVQYAGAICHVMNRGDRLEPIFDDEQDHVRFLETLGEASNSHFEQERGKTMIFLRTKFSTPLRSQRHRNSQHNNHCTSITRCWQTRCLPNIMRIAEFGGLGTVRRIQDKRSL